MLIYAIVKFIVYTVWSAAGIAWLTNDPPHFSTALGLGTLRWGLGLFLGVLVFFTVPLSSSDNTSAVYFKIYTPLRILEWGIVLLIILTNKGKLSGKQLLLRSALWIVGGILVSFITDLVSPEGLAGKFCVGKCLC